MTPARFTWMLLALCLGIGAAGFALFGPHSYGAHDQGFTLAYSWRLVGGQVPYLDFYYRRPPATLYLHTIWFALPDGWALLASRAAFYAQMALATALPTWAAVRAGLVAPSGRLLSLSGAFLVVALHNFPAMAWSTVDGVFFSACGLALLLRSLAGADRPFLLARAGASLCFALAALCKQPFVFVAASFGAFAVVEWARGRSGRLLAASAAPALGLAAITFGGLASVGALSAFFEQIVPASSEGDLGKAGFAAYGVPWFAIGLTVGLLWPAFIAATRTRLTPLRPILPVLEAGLIVAPLALVPDYFNVGRAYLGAALGLLAWRTVDLFRTERPALAAERLVLHAGIVIIAWSVSISWGYRSPTLGLGAMALLLPAIETTDRSLARLRLLSPAAAAAVLIVSIYAAAWTNWYKPLYDRARSAQVGALHEVFPRFGYVFSNLGLTSQMSELREHIERHALEPDRAFVVLNEFPLAHYLVDRQSPVLLDWYFWMEIRGEAEPLVQDILEKRPVVIMLKKRNVSPIGWTGGFGVPCEPETFDFWPRFSRRIFEAGELIGSGRFFCVVDLAAGGG